MTERFLAAFGFIETIENCSDLEQLLSAFHHLVQQFGLSTFCAGSPTAPKLNGNTSIWAKTWPAEWDTKYRQSNYAAIDPVVYAFLKSPVAFRWSMVRQQARDEHVHVMDEARDFNLHDGLGIPIHRNNELVGGISIAGSQLDLTKKEEMALHLASIYFHAKLEELVPKPPAEGPSLTQREVDCLSWVAAGKTDWEISQILGISERTAKQHALSATHKLNAVNRSQAVAYAILRHIIAP